MESFVEQIRYYDIYVFKLLISAKIYNGAIDFFMLQ